MNGADSRHFVKVYRGILRDPKFVEVRSDRACLGTWLLLLLEADAFWPDPASLPRWAEQDHIDLLERVGLVIVEADDRYRIKGLDAERNAQRTKASHAAQSRWHSAEHGASNAPSDAPSIAPVMPTRPDVDTDQTIDTSLNGPLDTREPRHRRTEVRGFAGPLGR